MFTVFIYILVYALHSCYIWHRFLKCKVTDLSLQKMANKSWCFFSSVGHVLKVQNTQAFSWSKASGHTVALKVSATYGKVDSLWWEYIRESVDSLCRDGVDAQYMQYLSKSPITSHHKYAKRLFNRPTFLFECFYYQLDSLLVYSLVGQKPRGRQLKARVCGSESAILSHCYHYVQQTISSNE